MEIGDVVFLNSNPELPMTVTFVLGGEAKGFQERFIVKQMQNAGCVNGDVYCTWFEGTNLKSGIFKAKMLTKK